ncbi:MAG: hypothetical protein K0Q91_1503 [Fibrobacteria bacterium]|jgi:uncharacterized protein YecE (DUF72 family)|nr:hypothetical protein [Fibrobacteria bacterium]
MKVRVGCAGWSLSSAVRDSFPGPGTHLERYARVFPAVEINSSFYRPHRPETYRRWAASVPPEFRFTAKIPKEITHGLRLRGAEEALERFLSEVTNLDEKLGVLLVQLPPSLACSVREARLFLQGFRKRFGGGLAWEARHATWFTEEADALLREFGVAAVAADPAPMEAAARPGGARDFAYVRLHGSPRMYYSAYPAEFLRNVAERVRAFPEAYVIFDNTAEGAAVPNALEFMKLVNTGMLAAKDRKEIST